MLNELKDVEVSSELLNQRVIGAVVFKGTYEEYLSVLTEIKQYVSVIYNMKSFDSNKKLIITEVKGGIQ